MTSKSGTRRVWWPLALVAALVYSLATAWPAAAVEEQLEPNEVRVVRAFVPGAPLHTPEDGRLRGYGFAVTVEGVSEALMVDDGIFEFKPPPGQKIVVFAVRFTAHGDRDHARPVRGTVIVDGRRSALDFSFGGLLETPLVAVAVPPDARRIDFEMAAAGLVQTFSVTERRRTGRQPAVLYRDAAAPEVVTDVNADRLVRIGDDRLTGSASITLKRVRLSWFSPRDTSTEEAQVELTTPDSPDRAYLVLEGEGEPVPVPGGDGSFEELGTVPASDIKLKLADGTEVEAKHAGPTDELLSGSYYFEVPADTTTATVLVGPTTVPATRRMEPLIERTDVRIERATFDVRLPPGNPPVKSDEAATPTSAGRGSGSTTPAAHDRDRAAAWLWPALVVLALAATVFTGWRVRRRRHPGTAPADGEEDAGLLAHQLVGLLGRAQDGHLGVGGPGALDAVRALVVRAGDEDGPATAIVLARDETARLVPEGIPAPPWLTVVADDDALFAAVEAAHFQRARLKDELDTDHDLRDDDALSYEARPFVVVVPGPVDGAVALRLLDLASRTPTRDPITVVAVENGAALRVEADGRLSGEGGAPARRVSVMSEGEAAVLLDVRAGEAVDAAGAVPPPPGGKVPEVVVLRLLGPYRITVAEREVASGLRSKARELLAYLAVHREGVTGDAAVEALWPGAAPDQAYFRTVVANLRTVLRTEAGLDESVPLVERAGQRYRLNPASVDVDLWRFEDDLTAAGRGEDDAASRAADAYRRDLLAGEDYPWADPVRERLRRRALDNLTGLAERKQAAGDLDAALHAAERAVELDPDAEEPYQRVMRLQRQLGRPDGARRTYEVLEARLRDLGVTPNATSRALGNGAEA